MRLPRFPPLCRPPLRAILAWVLVLAHAHAAVAAPVVRGVCGAKGRSACGGDGCACAAPEAAGRCCGAPAPAAELPACCAKKAACCSAETEPPRACCAKHRAAEVAPAPRAVAVAAPEPVAGGTHGPVMKPCHCKKPVPMASPFAEPAVRPDGDRATRFPPPPAGRPSAFLTSAPIPSDDSLIRPPRLG